MPSKFLKGKNTYESFPILFLIALILMPFKGFTQKKSLKEQNMLLKEKMYNFILSDTSDWRSSSSTTYGAMMKFFAWDSTGKKVLIVYYTSNIYHDLKELYGVSYQDFRKLGEKMMDGDTILSIDFYGEIYNNAIVSADAEYKEVDSIWNKGVKFFFKHSFSCYLYFTGDKEVPVFLKLFDVNVALAGRKAIFFSASQKEKILGKPVRKRIYNEEDGSLRCDCDDWDRGIWRN